MSIAREQTTEGATSRQTHRQHCRSRERRRAAPVERAAVARTSTMREEWIASHCCDSCACCSSSRRCVSSWTATQRTAHRGPLHSTALHVDPTVTRAICTPLTPSHRIARMRLVHCVLMCGCCVSRCPAPPLCVCVCSDRVADCAGRSAAEKKNERRGRALHCTSDPIRSAARIAKLRLPTPNHHPSGRHRCSCTPLARDPSALSLPALSPTPP